MKKILFAVTCVCAHTALLAQGPSPGPSPNDVELLRQQVQALTETVKNLQQQVREQQDALSKINIEPSTLPANNNIAAAPSASPSASAPPAFPTTDESVVASAAPAPPPTATGPAAAAVNSQFPTSDASVTTSTETISSSGAGASLTAPMTIAGGGRTYMNISFDGQFALAYSSDRDLDKLESAITIRCSAASMRATSSWPSRPAFVLIVLIPRLAGACAVGSRLIHHPMEPMQTTPRLRERMRF